jgi:ubiquitin C-terminal hydrolase
MGSSDSKLGKVLEEEFPGTERYYGFYNYGNTCYANSVLQALYFCQPLRVALMNWSSQRAALLHLDAEKKHKESLTDTLMKVATSVASGGSSAKDMPLLAALSELFDEIGSQKKQTGTIKPFQFISTLKRQNIMFDSTSQQDAHEFLMYVLNEVSESLEKEEKEMVKKLKELKRVQSDGEEGGEKENELAAARGTGSANSFKTFVQNIFQGTLTNETRCLTCESVSEREETFFDVPLDVEQNCSVSHCLARFSKIERLAGTNKFHCECCGGLQEAEKRVRFKKLPNILVLHLKRFKYLEHPGIHAKLSHRVTFPIELRIPDTQTSFDSFATDSDGLSSSLPTYQNEKDPLYYLTALVAHIGPTAQSGHYVAFIRSGDKWLSMDDHIVHPVNDTDTLMNKLFGCWNHNPEEPQNSAAAYILFYERRPAGSL